MTSLLLVQMAALAAHLEAVAEALRQEVEAGASAAAPPAGRCPKCGAGEFEDASTIGQRMTRCTVCGEEWEPTELFTRS